MSTKQIKIRELYNAVLRKFEPAPMAYDILNCIMSGSDKAEDYEVILRTDRFITSTICNKASEPMKKTVVRSLGHAFVLMGAQKTRNGVLGHILQRVVSENADKTFQSFEEAEKKVKYAMAAEEQAKKVNNEYLGLAYSSGYLYDLAANALSQDNNVAATVSPLLESTWKHGLNTATIAWSLATHERILITFRKHIFGAGLVHDFGKVGLAMMAPEDYKGILAKFEEEKKINISDDSYESTHEKNVFDLSHEEVGSLILFHSRLLQELEQEVDFHHNLSLLKSRSPDGFLAGAILNVADRISTLMANKSNFEIDDFKDILLPHKKYIPLNYADVYQMVSTLKAKQLLT